MKTCIPCGWTGKTDGHTCPKCGEASWLAEGAVDGGAKPPVSEYPKSKRDRR